MHKNEHQLILPFLEGHTPFLMNKNEKKMLNLINEKKHALGGTSTHLLTKVI
jgi:hypothetical protein